MILRLLIVCLALILPACVGAQPSGTQGPAAVSPQLFEVPTGREKVNIPVWWIPHDAAQATLVIFSGGPGSLGPNNNDALNGPRTWEGHPGTPFMVWDWKLVHKAGFNIAIVGRAQDQPSLRLVHTLHRSSAEHSREIRNVLLHLKQMAPEDIWLVGQSAGTISTANAAIANPDLIAGQVLLGSLTHLGKATGPRGPIPSTGLDYGEIRVPTFLLTHSQDACVGNLPEDARDNFAALTNAPRKELVFLSGGRARGNDPCSLQHYHGLPGLEEEVVTRVDSWIRASSSE